MRVTSIEICLYRFGTIQPICNGESWCEASCYNLAHLPFFSPLHFDLTRAKGSFHRALNIWSLKILYSYIFLHYYYVQKKRESLAYISTFGIFWPKDICAQKYKKKIGLFVLQTIQIIVSMCTAFVPLHISINTGFAWFYIPKPKKKWQWLS